MKKYLSKGMLGLALLSLTLLQACNADFTYSPGGYHGGGWGYGHHHGGYYGGHHGGYHGGHHGGHRPWPYRSNLMSTESSIVAPSNFSLATQAFARDFGVSQQSAEKILTIAQSKHLKRDLKQLGLELRDFMPLKNLEMPSDQSIHRVAQVLGEEPNKIEIVFSRFISDMKAAQTVK